MNDYEKLARAQELIAEVQQNLESPPSDFPIPEDQLEFRNGNVWKPESESDGKLVVILRDEWPVPDRVEVLERSGLWVGMTYTGSDHNGNRHHYRGAFPGGPLYMGKRKGGGVRVYYGTEFGFIPLPGPPKKRWE